MYMYERTSALNSISNPSLSHSLSRSLRPPPSPMRLPLSPSLSLSRVWRDPAIGGVVLRLLGSEWFGWNSKNYLYCNIVGMEGIGKDCINGISNTNCRWRRRRRRS
ncbi:hypothetical protein Scep_017537 [Stephania cephalantha]|uniref:Uncharacterized protein n=1 Tax=Stephania cephalantha TaxID=152367 RepID=A0AAP0IPM2_9MAGN